MSRWCIYQVISLRTWTELYLCAAWARKVQLVAACIDNALATPYSKETQDAGYIRRSVDSGRCICAQKRYSICRLEGDRKCTIVSALLGALSNTSNYQWFATFVLSWLVAVFHGFSGYTPCPICTCQIANRA